VFAGSLSFVFATLIASGAGVDVRTSAPCPSAAGISDRLKPLLPPADTNGARDVALIDVLDVRPDSSADVLIRLLRPDTSEIGNRRVGLTGTCEDMAEAVAAILATWETDTQPESSPAEEPAASMVKEEPTVAAGTPLQTSAWNVLVGTGTGLSFIDGVAANGMAEVVVGKGDSAWQLRAGANVQTARTLTLSSGQADWQHTTFAAGLLWRTLGSAWRLSVDAGPVLGWATIEGSGFSPSRKQRVFEYGPTAGVRVGRTWGRWTLWAETRANLWLPAVQATAKDPVSGQAVASADVTSVDTSVGLGLSVVLFP
jgi:hypothetical protein